MHVFGAKKERRGQQEQVKEGKREEQGRKLLSLGSTGRVTHHTHVYHSEALNILLADLSINVASPSLGAQHTG